MVTGCLQDTDEVLSGQDEKSLTRVDASTQLVLSSGRQHTMIVLAVNTVKNKDGSS